MTVERIKLLEEVETWDGSTKASRLWPKGTIVTREDLDPDGVRPGFFDVILEGGHAQRVEDHELYKPSDFTHDEIARRNQLAILVCEGGLGICKRCGAGEVQLDDYPTCEEYRAAMRKKRTCQ
jgi:hypothetical protein